MKLILLLAIIAVHWLGLAVRYRSRNQKQQILGQDRKVVDNKLEQLKEVHNKRKQQINNKKSKENQVKKDKNKNYNQKQNQNQKQRLNQNQEQKKLDQTIKTRTKKKTVWMNSHLKRPEIVHGDESRNSAIELLEQCHSDQMYQLSVMIDDGVMKVVKGMENGKCAMARFKDQINNIGWDTLQIEGDMNKCGENNSLQQEWGYYAMGYLEGLLSYQQIRYLWNSYIGKYHFAFYQKYELLSEQVIKQNVAYQLVLDDMKKVYNKMQRVVSRLSDQEYKEQLIKQDYQYNGILDGFNKIAEEKIQQGQKAFLMTNEMFMIINYDGAIDDLKSYSNMYQSRFAKMVSKLGLRFRKMPQHEQKFLEKLEKQLSLRCNVLFKITDSKDIVMSHSTMDSYYAMQRVFKYLEVKEKDGLVKKITYSSYPGCLSSTDDFFMVDGNLMVTETTLSGELNNQQKKNVYEGSEYHYIPEFMKVMASNHLASSAYDWTQKMNVLKGAIYYSQWLVFDLKKYEQNKKEIENNGGQNVEASQQDGFLFILEDGYNENPIQPIQMDERLKTNKYVASVNSVFDPDEDVSNSYGRQAMFYQKQKFAQNIEGIEKVMAYNEQSSDADYLSTEDQNKREIEQQYDNSIATETTGVNFPFLEQNGGVGVIDIKVTDSANLRKNKCFTRAGPVKNANHVSFAWNPQSKPEGQPQFWNFNFVPMGPNINM